jgi:hypothetical protein
LAAAQLLGVVEVGDVDEGEDIVLLLGRIQPAAKLVAAAPERAVELGLLQRHMTTSVWFD